MSGTVAVIVSSYNRPRMLAECLDSITPWKDGVFTYDGASQIVIADDGSDFNVWKLAAPLLIASVLRPKDAPSPEQRLTVPRVGRLLNAAIRKVWCDYVTVLCDDDLLAPGWLRVAAAALDAHPAWHMVRGEWGLFNDGERPDPARLCPFGFSPPLTAGNFLYRVSCAIEEGCWWNEDSLAVHDGPMLVNYLQRHGGSGPRPKWLGYLDVLAGYRREHPKTVSNHSLFGGDRYLPSAEALFALPGGME